MFKFILLLIYVLITACFLYLKPIITEVDKNNGEKPITFPMWAVIVHIFFTLSIYLGLIYYPIIIAYAYMGLSSGKYSVDDSHPKAIRIDSFLNKVKSFFTHKI